MKKVRRSFVAGYFYPGSKKSCLEALKRCTEGEEHGDVPDMAPRVGICPHAGWEYSGPTAGKVFSFFKKYPAPETFIIFGAVHRYFGSLPVVISAGEWETPLGNAGIDSEVAEELVSLAGEKVKTGMEAHDGEHSIEVLVPFVKYLFPEARIIPVLTPSTEASYEVGKAAGRLMADNEKIAAIGSTDLTHYGAEMGFEPKGRGQKALEWVKTVNDKRIVDLACGMEAEKIIEEARQYHNACGAGAVAAAIFSARGCGRKVGRLLEYTTSYDVTPDGHQPGRFVGYAGIVY